MNIVRHFRSSRGTRRRSMSVVQSFKKIINTAPASVAASTAVNFVASTGQDSVAAGQTSAVDTNVPTGSVIKFIEWQFSIQNLVNVAAYCWIILVRLDSGQTAPSPQTVGGSPVRNQVHRQLFFTVGQNQNVNRTIRFPVPAKYQRVKEASTWRLRVESDQVSSMGCQTIYKFLR